jgi:hypothetical protein
VTAELPKGSLVDFRNLPPNYPTQRHSGQFWEALGRTVATFGFLENVLGRAIFALTGTKEIPEEGREAAFAAWLPTLERALSDPLGGLIISYNRAVRENGRTAITNFDALVANLQEASAIRNVLCHGFWPIPDDHGRSVPFFVNRKTEVWQTPVDVPYLQQVQTSVVELCCAVINSVTHMGWQFPGTGGPGAPIFTSRSAGAPV